MNNEKLTLKELNILIKFLEEQENWTRCEWYNKAIPNCFCVHAHICYNPKSPFLVSTLIGQITPIDHIYYQLTNELTKRFGIGNISFININDNTYEAQSALSEEVTPKERVLTILYILQYELEQEIGVHAVTYFNH